MRQLPKRCPGGALCERLDGSGDRRTFLDRVEERRPTCSKVVSPSRGRRCRRAARATRRGRSSRGSWSARRATTDIVRPARTRRPVPCARPCSRSGRGCTRTLASPAGAYDAASGATRPLGHTSRAPDMCGGLTTPRVRPRVCSRGSAGSWCNVGAWLWRSPAYSSSRRSSSESVSSIGWQARVSTIPTPTPSRPGPNSIASSTQDSPTPPSS